MIRSVCTTGAIVLLTAQATTAATFSVTNTNAITATDASLILRKAVGQSVVLNCQTCG